MRARVAGPALLMVASGCFDPDVGQAVLICDDAADCPSPLACVIDRCVSETDRLGATCGDGIVATDGDEACDEGEANDDTGACTRSCQRNVCGDGLLHLGVEVCDDGNTVSGDGCRADCLKREVCGDGQPDPGERCDGDDVGVQCTDTCEPLSCATATPVELGADVQVEVAADGALGMVFHVGPDFTCFGPGPEFVYEVRARDALRLTVDLQSGSGFGVYSIVRYDGDGCGAAPSACSPPDFNQLGSAAALVTDARPGRAAVSRTGFSLSKTRQAEACPTQNKTG